MYTIISTQGVELRLAGGRIAKGGRVELKLGGVWGTVCDVGFDDLDAKVMNRLLKH